MMRRPLQTTAAPALKVLHNQFPVETRGDCDIIDVTQEIQRIVQKAGIDGGMMVACVAGSTAALTTIENEPGLLKDFKTAVERLLPSNLPYAHDAAWGDGNGHAHLRASIIGPSVTIPIHNGTLKLGTWQQIVLIDFDNRSRRREIFVQMIGVG